jgi:protein-L-isoaspartate(D-aspartate) O-methyltransferase
MTATIEWEAAPATHMAHGALVSSLTRQGFDARTVAAIAEMPRHPFVPNFLWRLGYADVDLWRFGLGPSARTAAVLIDAADVRPHERCVELGTGSGWVAAVLTQLAAQVSTVGRFPGEWAAPALRATKVAVLGCADLAPGGPQTVLPEADVVIATFAPDRVPVPVLRAMRPGARLVVAVGRRPQPVTVLTQYDTGVDVQHRGAVRLGARAELDAALNTALTVPGGEGR